MTENKKSRRKVLGGIAGVLGASTIASNAAAAVMTPSAAEGPFYPTPAMRLPDIDNDLVRVAGLVQDAGGEVFLLRGNVTDANDTPLTGLRVEIWQCDLNGNYMHPGDSRSANFDPSFQGFGHDITDESGAYVFRTIKPTVYPGRTPHIHVKVLNEGRELLTTQFYIKDEPNNARDGLYARMTAEQAKAVSMTFVDGSEGPEAIVNIVV